VQARARLLERIVSARYIFPLPYSGNFAAGFTKSQTVGGAHSIKFGAVDRLGRCDRCSANHGLDGSVSVTGNHSGSFGIYFFRERGHFGNRHFELAGKVNLSASRASMASV